MIAVLGGLGAAFAWATTMICATRAARLIGATSVLAWVMLIGLVLTLPWALIRGVPEVDGNATRWLILAGVGNCVGLLLVYTGVRIGKVGVVAPIVSTEGAIAALIAVAAGEQLAPGTGAALVVIAVGIVLAAASRDSSGSGSRTSDIRAALFGAAAAVSFGASLYATGRVSTELPVAWAILPPRVVGVVAIALPLAIAGRLTLTRRALPFVLGRGRCRGGRVCALRARRTGRDRHEPPCSRPSSAPSQPSWPSSCSTNGSRRLQVVGIAAIAAGVAVMSALQA